MIKLMGCFYSDAEKNRTILEQIIQTVHSHTLAVEMSARLLESGIMEPLLLLKKLKEEKVALDATDTIGISKDGKSRKATYSHVVLSVSAFRSRNRYYEKPCVGFVFRCSKQIVCELVKAA